LDFSKLEKLELEVLNKIKEPPNTSFLFIYSRKTGFLEYFSIAIDALKI
jgi:hypothetical protein